MNEIQKLRDRIDELEELLGLTERIDMIHIPMKYRRRTEVVIRLLAKRELVSVIAIGLAMGLDQINENSIKVYVSKARAALRLFGIAVKNDWGRGWYLSAADRQKLRELIGRELREVAA